METTKNTVSSIIYDYLDFSSNDDIEASLTREELEKLELVQAKTISKKICEDKNINISLIALKELETLGFKNDLSTFVLSKLVEDVYHEREVFNSSDYFDLSMENNEHYSNLAEYFKIGEDQLYKALVAKSIGESTCETKNINDIVYNTVNNISNKLISSMKIKLDA